MTPTSAAPVDGMLTGKVCVVTSAGAGLGRAIARLFAHAGANPAIIAFCWSHARRQFYDLPIKAKAPTAEEALRRIAAFYAVEAEIRGSSPERRLAARQARCRPLVEELFAWFEAMLAKLPARSTTADAIRYALNHRDGLLRFLDDGRIELDTNSVERAARPVALGRKNALFAGCDEGAEAWASIASLIETCMCGWPPRRKGFSGVA